MNSFTNNDFSNLYFEKDKNIQVNEDVIDKSPVDEVKPIAKYINNKTTDEKNKIFRKILILNFNDQDSTLIERVLKELDIRNYNLQLIKIHSLSEAKKELITKSDIAVVFVNVDSEDDNFAKDVISLIRKSLKNDLIQIVLKSKQDEINIDLNYIIKNKISYCLNNSDLKLQKLKVIAASCLRSFNTNKKNKDYNSNLSKIIKRRTKDLLDKNEELLNVDATKNKMFSIIAHDLVNPFNSILGLSKLLKEQFNDFNKEKIELFADEIYKTSENTYNLLSNLLEWARTQTGKINYVPNKVLINDLIKNNIIIHKKLADKKSLKLNYDLSKNIYVYCDSNMINTILRNLISNGIKFTENGEVTISTDIDHEYCSICITDTGQGIPNDKVENLFTFENLSTKGTDGEKGSGLGLLLCNEFALRNNGSITVNSKVNSGSTFCVKIPLFK